MAYGQVGKDSDLGFLAGPLFCKSTDIVEEETAHILFILLSVLKEGRVRQTLYLWIEINSKVQPELETRECPVLLLGRRPFPDTQLSLTGHWSSARKQRLPRSLPYEQGVPSQVGLCVQA